MSFKKKSLFGKIAAELHELKIRPSLKKRTLILTAFCVALSTLTIGTLSYVRIRSETLHLAETHLATEAQLLSQRFSFDYHLIANDLRTVSETPPLQGLIRSMKNDGVDPLDGSTDALWRSRLATIFQAVLRGRPEYFQFRYIGVEDAGRELVRVDRTRYGLKVKESEELQQKKQESYFKYAVQAPSGEVVFSDISYNREYGQQDGAYIATLRGMMPIDDDDGNRFGFLVINVNYETMLKSAFSEINPEQHTFVVNGSGDFMEHSLGMRQTVHRLEMNGSLTRPLPDIVRRVQETTENQGLFYTPDEVGYFIRDTSYFSQASANLGVIVTVSRKDWYAAATQSRNEVLIVGLIVISISTLIAVVFTRSMMQPLSDLADAVRHSSDEDSLEYLPTERNDEIGELASAIQKRNSELMESRTRASAIVNNVVDGLILIDGYGLIEQFNPSCERMFGYTASEAIGCNIKTLMKPEDAKPHDGYLKRYRDGLGGRTLDITRELEAVDKSGRIFPIELSINAVKFNGTTKFSGVIRDISQRREIDRLRREFVSTVSHELRTPLTSIRGSLTLIDTLAPDDLPPKVFQLIGMARKNTERLIQLVNEILDFEKLRANKTKFEMKVLDLNSEIEKALELNQGYADDAGIQLDAELASNEILVSLESTKFQQIMSNLISNAVKFSNKGHTVTLRTMVSRRKGRIEVVDKGVGIDENFRKHIFQAFSQADGSATRSEGGTGLGLNISKSFVEGMHGQIGFDSLVGSGTTFWVEFPLQVANGLGGNPLPNPADTRLLGLHLEDDNDFHTVLAAGLEPDLDLVHVRTVEEARRRLDEQEFDIVILDRLIEDGDGLDLIQFIPAPERTKILVVTAVDENVQHIHVDATLIKAKTRPGEFAARVSELVEEIKQRKSRVSGAA
ncbi:sensor histidine kinase [Roseibium marinum]|uniref:histidine kinase n=1 Tax=Roseibium marinum TaxID=281252 RepID=A0A2S3UPW0_9HYPH|nr:sensor histidine kinase [Roseibium marinum]POF29620.1 PAS domain S-box-containing protein [Roseibium marinum]